MKRNFCKIVINPTRFFYSIFHMVARINNGTIFSLLPLNAIFVAISMYRIEHVCISLFWNFLLNSYKFKLLNIQILNFLFDLLNFTFSVIFLIFEFFFSNFQAEFDVVSFSVNILYIGSSLCWPYIFCHFGTHAVNSIASISDITFNSNWYDFVSDWQKGIILIIARSQQTVQFSGYKIFPCNLTTFGSVRFSTYKNTLYRICSFL